MFLHDDSSGRAEIARPRIIAETLPGVENVTFGGCGQSGEIGKAPHPLTIIGDDSGDLRLLKHELGDQDRVGIGGTAPGEIAAVFSIPREERSLEGGGVRRRVQVMRNV